jgi:hypothetical protein
MFHLWWVHFFFYPKSTLGFVKGIFVNFGTGFIFLNLVVSFVFLSKKFVLGSGGRYRYFHIFSATSSLVNVSLFAFAALCNCFICFAFVNHYLL